MCESGVVVLNKEIGCVIYLVLVVDVYQCEDAVVF
jgi:hypothetical protein